MPSGHRKRKHNGSHDRPDQQHRPVPPEPDLTLFIQAHEADIVRGPRAAAAARALDAAAYTEGGAGQSGLIRWGGDKPAANTEQLGSVIHDDDDFNLVREDGCDVWVDRYDARLLLDSLVVPDVTTSPPPSPTGWSDLPSDTEDTFFFTPDETEDYRREKRRRIIDETREARLKARQEEDGDYPDEEDVWGASDEEPDDTQRDLMRRTAAHILASPNPAQLEMRILANHGGDKRFAFLRGRWARAWRAAKARVRAEDAKKRVEHAHENSTPRGEGSDAPLGALAGYGDSDDDSSGEEGMAGDEEGATRGNDPTSAVPEAVHDQEDEGQNRLTGDDAVKEARRARAREWAEKRRKTRS
ncbi:hypothetical protein PLICRDRAFT_342392 [Plicaturopsis crispa FD-325 SS-3]|uniref:SURP motif domain-containing protein n=1 Tax=Plicaturopsis crispa FD-325 SS-3 TaxID=944288 RepID=A0A0C9T998_PLICR|nr:hypothetical protein PLICRDRAFT_342392 [Plicaturopsis crispa FD-325 SS-3]